MFIGWLTCIPAVLLPHSPCRSTTANAPANRQMPIASVVRGKRKKKEEKEFVLESNDVKSRIFELIWLATNLLLIGKYFLDKFTIQCEPCIDLNDCPPCQTDFMKNFWLYMLILNLVFSIGLVVKNRIKKRK